MRENSSTTVTMFPKSLTSLNNGGETYFCTLIRLTEATVNWVSINSYSIRKLLSCPGKKVTLRSWWAIWMPGWSPTTACSGMWWRSTILRTLMVMVRGLRVSTASTSSFYAVGLQLRIVNHFGHITLSSRSCLLAVSNKGGAEIGPEQDHYLMLACKHEFW